MATGFSTKSGPDGYRLNFDTDNLDYYLLMQKIARHCVDGKPDAAVAEVVRCKDCVWRGREECAMFYCCNCGEQHTWETDNDFCSYGARMDKEAEHEAG